MVRKLLVACVIVVALLVPVSSAEAQVGEGTIAPAALADQVYSPSDMRAYVPSPFGLSSSPVGLSCPKKATIPTRAMGRAAALSLADRALRSLASRRALRAFARSKAFANKDFVSQDVMTALQTGRPAGALALELRAARLEPAKPRHILNAAVLLMGFGRTAEAAALVSVASGAKASGAGFGVSEAHQLTAVKAELAALTGSFAAAERLYSSAAAASPLFAEARTGVGLSAYCQNKPAIGAVWVARGSRRLDAVAPPDQPPTVFSNVAEDRDGVDPASFGIVRFPPNPQVAVARHAELKADFDASIARVNQYTADVHALSSSPHKTPSDASQAAAIYANQRLDLDPKLADLRQQQLAPNHTFRTLYDTGDAGGCPVISTNHVAIVSALQTLYDLDRQIAVRYHHLATALASEIADPFISATLNLQADDYAYTLFQGSVQKVYYLSDLELGCNSPGADPDPGTPSVAAPDLTAGTTPCDIEKSNRLRFKPPGSAITMEGGCEGGKVEVVVSKFGPSEAYLGYFGEVGTKWKTGDVTVYVGTKASVTSGRLPLPVGGNIKMGVYVTAGPNKGGLPEFGQTSRPWVVKDYGIRLQATAEVQGGNGTIMTINKWDSKMDLTLVGAFSR